jgi:hypothetical protein
MQYLKDTNSNQTSTPEDDLSTWCILSVNNKQIKAKIRHIGKGRFEIISDGNDGEYTTRVVDASDVLHCK